MGRNEIVVRTGSLWFGRMCGWRGSSIALSCRSRTEEARFDLEGYRASGEFTVLGSRVRMVAASLLV